MFNAPHTYSTWCSLSPAEPADPVKHWQGITSKKNSSHLSQNGTRESSEIVVNRSTAHVKKCESTCHRASKQEHPCGRKAISDHANTECVCESACVGAERVCVRIRVPVRLLLLLVIGCWLLVEWL